jgi:sugar transferase (PEP-CTERM/EpsH1 system associated)
MPEVRREAGERADPRPLIAHVLFRFDYGGLENGVVNVINGLPAERFRHAVVALTEASAFASRIARADVTVHALNKRAGNDPAMLLRLYRLLRTLRPAIVHTRNLATIEGALVARLAGVPRRIHGEHGWDVYDPDGTSRRYRALRRLMNPAIHRFVALSAELEQWLLRTVGIAAGKVVRICNGVDTERFAPAPGAQRALLQGRFAPASVIVGSVTRFSAIKDPLNLVRAFIAARREPFGAPLRLVMLGDGALKAEAERMLDEAGLAADAWLPGSRDDVAPMLREFDIFALGSAREGISNTVLEAMASGLPVIASATGGNLELIEDGVSGRLVPAQDAAPLARALLDYASNPNLRATHGAAARARAVGNYSLRQMLAAYQALYNGQCAHLREAA